VTEPKIVRPRAVLTAGNASFLRQLIPHSKYRAAKCDASDTLARKKFKTIKAILAKILTIPMF
jgi:hypothetical protein